MRLIQCVWWDCAICAKPDYCIFKDWSHYAICLFDLMFESWRVNLTVRASLLLLQMANCPNFVSFVSLNGRVTPGILMFGWSHLQGVCAFVCLYVSICDFGLMIKFWLVDLIKDPSLNGWSHLEGVFAFVEHLLYRCYRHVTCIVTYKEANHSYLIE